MRETLKDELKEEIKEDLKLEIADDLRAEIKLELKKNRQYSSGSDSDGHDDTTSND